MIIVIAIFVCVDSYGNWKAESEQQEATSSQIRDGAYGISETPATFPFSEPSGRVEGTSREIVNDVVLGDVPAADYSYPFDGTLGNAVAVKRSGDENGYNSGTYPEADAGIVPVFKDGIEGKAIYLDGTYGIELKDIVKPLSDSYTISFWFKAEEIPDWSPFMIIGSNLLDVGVSQNYISFNKKTIDEEEIVPIFNTVNSSWGNSCEIRPSLEDKKCIDLNEWNFITVCVDGTEISEEDQNKLKGYLYLNSELIGAGEVSRMYVEEQNMRAYVGISCFDALFRAYYDEIHIWNTRLSEHQISEMYIEYLKIDSSY